MSTLPTATWLRRRLAQAPAHPPVTAGDGWLWRQDLRDAAVLIPIVRYAEDDLRVLFTVRADHLYDHAGQISFPGGRAEPDDIDPWQTAARESGEEIGIVEFERLATLSLYTTVTGYRVTPVVGFVDGPPALRLDPTEVAEVFEVPLAHLLDPVNHQRHTVVHKGRERHYYALPYERRYIWGATAGMLMNFHAHVSGEG